MLPFLSVQKDLVPSLKDNTQNISVAAEEHTMYCKLSVGGKLWACWEEGRFLGKVQIWPTERAEQGGTQVLIPSWKHQVPHFGILLCCSVLGHSLLWVQPLASAAINTPEKQAGVWR